jgi:hypothetical protein
MTKAKSIAVIVAAIVAVAAVVVLVQRARAASDDAWAEFRHDVETKCLEAAQPMFETASATVDPFGSESYGLALIEGKAVGADAQIASICVYDKQDMTVEIGGELPRE